MILSDKYPKKRVFITGAGSGLGRALALEFAAEGWTIGMTDINGNTLQTVADEVRRAGGFPFLYVFDVSVEAEMQRAVEDFCEKKAGLDILINNAGVGDGGFFGEYTTENWRWIVGINQMAVIYGTHYALPFFKKQKSGHIINIASAAAFANAPKMSAYSVTKAAVLSLSETLYTELKPDNINVSVVMPTFFKTNIDQFSHGDEATKRMTKKLIENSNLEASTVAKEILRKAGRSKLHIVLPTQSRVVYFVKRHFPGLFFMLSEKIFKKMNESNLVLLFLLFFSISTNAQESTSNFDYGRATLKTLCSPEFKGRGYVERGDSIAADWLQKEFKRVGLQPAVDGAYFQSYSFPVNTLPGKMSVKIGKKRLVPGKDYLVHPDAPTLKGAYDIVPLSKAEMANEEALAKKIMEAKGKFLMIDMSEFDLKGNKEDKKLFNEIEPSLKYQDGLPIAGVICLEPTKLTWFPSMTQALHPEVVILKSALPQKIKKLSINIEALSIDDYPTQNVIGKVTGSLYPDSIVMVTAHYDHLGKMGKETYFPGANDNASGVSMLCALARHFAKPENKPSCTMIFAAFSGEEIGLMGSKYYTEHPIYPLSNIKFLLNIDIMGTGIDGIQVVNGSVFRKLFDRLVAINAEKNLLKEIKIRGEACNSDHCYFYREKVTCMYAYTLGGISFYHDVFDKAETLTFEEFEDIFTLYSTFLKEF